MNDFMAQRFFFDCGKVLLRVRRWLSIVGDP
jgi:hypothetical protein